MLASVALILLLLLFSFVLFFFYLIFHLPPTNSRHAASMAFRIRHTVTESTQYTNYDAHTQTIDRIMKLFYGKWGKTWKWHQNNRRFNLIWLRKKNDAQNIEETVWVVGIMMIENAIEQWCYQTECMFIYNEKPYTEMARAKCALRSNVEFLAKRSA